MSKCNKPIVKERPSASTQSLIGKYGAWFEAPRPTAVGAPHHEELFVQISDLLTPEALGEAEPRKAHKGICDFGQSLRMTTVLDHQHCFHFRT